MAVFLLLEQSEEYARHFLLTHASRHTHRVVPTRELVTARRANAPDLFLRWLPGGMQDLGEPVVVELLLDWLDPFLTTEEQDRLLG